MTFFQAVLRRFSRCAASLLALRSSPLLVTCHASLVTSAKAPPLFALNSVKERGSHGAFTLSTINSQLSSERLPYSPRTASWSDRRRSSLPARRSPPGPCAQPSLCRDRPRAA